MQYRYDVVVVGAGVSGLFTAYNLAKKGLKVAVIEMKSYDEIGEKVCGDAIGAHHFDEVGLEKPMIGIDAVAKFRGVKVVSPDEKHVIVVEGEGYALDRKAFGRRLLRLAENAGVDIYPQHRFSRSITEGSWVKGIVAKKGSEEVEFRSKVVVDASGVVSVVRRSLPSEWWVSEPLPKEDFCATYREIWEADIDIDREYAWIYLNQELAPGGYWWLFPKGESGIYNVGLGVQIREGAPNPRLNFIKFIRSRFRDKIRRIVHSGGGIVPTRRPIPCMVWNGFIVVGDAATTANPLHGGGIGPALVSAKLAAETITNALLSGGPSIDRLWEYHKKYIEAYGAKQASLDILRMYLQRISNEGLNFIFRSNIVKGVDVYEMGMYGEIKLDIITKLSILVKSLRQPKLLEKLYRVKQFMDNIKRLYREYPDKPEGYPIWRQKEKELIESYKAWLSTI